MKYIYYYCKINGRKLEREEIHMKKSTISLLLVLGMILSFLPQASAASSFQDVTLYEDEINFLSDQGIINGYENGTLFKPKGPIKRLQAVQMILREMGVTNYSGAPNPNFTDMKPGDYGYEEVAKAVQLGFIGGKTATNGSKYFDPWGTLTRGQMAKILVEGYNIDGTYPKQFSDVGPSHWAVDYVSSLAGSDITTGYQDGSFKPENKLQRQHFAVFMARLLNDEFKPTSEFLDVDFINIGQGDSILIQTPNHKNILVDGGKRSEGDMVLNYLASKGVDSLDLVVATHPDADHIGGLIDVLQTIEVKEVLDSGKTHTSQTYLDYLAIIDEKNIPFTVAQEGDFLGIDSEVTIEVLNSGSENADNNESSIVLIVSHGEVDYLLTGDAGVEVEERMMSEYNLDAEVLKVGHHGSDTSTSQAFVEAVNPIFGILSYGEGNQYGHPSSEVYMRLVNEGVELIETVYGDIEFMDDGEYIYIGQDASGPNPDPEPQPADLAITGVDLDAEVVTIKNNGSADIDMTGWKLVSVEGTQTFDFPANYVLTSGSTVRVTSGQNAIDSPPNYLKWTGSYIWNNNGDAAQLFNSQGELVSEY
jgi:competence protein ComEC